MAKLLENLTLKELENIAPQFVDKTMLISCYDIDLYHLSQFTNNTNMSYVVGVIINGEITWNSQ